MSLSEEELWNLYSEALLFCLKGGRAIMKFVTSCSKCGKRINVDEFLGKSSASALVIVKVGGMEKETNYTLCPKCSNKLKKWMDKRW